MGAWSFVDRRIEALLRELDVRTNRPGYAGREESAATATGLLARHNREQAALVDEALNIHGEAGQQAGRAGARHDETGRKAVRAGMRGPAKSAKTRAKAKSAKAKGARAKTAGTDERRADKAIGASPAKKAPAKAEPARAKTKVT